MDGLDYVIISGIKKIVLMFPVLGTANNLIASNLNVSILPFLGLLAAGKIILIYSKSDSFQKKWDKYQHKDLISNVLMIVGVITMVVILL